MVWLQSKNRVWSVRDGIHRDDPVLAVLPTEATWFQNIQDNADPNIAVIDKPGPNPVPQLGQPGRRLARDVKKKQAPQPPKPVVVSAGTYFEVHGEVISGDDLLKLFEHLKAQAAKEAKEAKASLKAPPPPPPPLPHGLKPMEGIFTPADEAAAKAKAEAEAKAKAEAEAKAKAEAEAKAKAKAAGK